MRKVCVSMSVVLVLFVLNQHLRRAVTRPWAVLSKIPLKRLFLALLSRRPTHTNRSCYDRRYERVWNL